MFKYYTIYVHVNNYYAIIHLDTVCMQRTALYLACEEGHAKCVEVLLKGGAKVTYCIQVAKDQQDCTEEDYQKRIKSCLGIAILRRHRFDHNNIIANHCS